MAKRILKVNLALAVLSATMWYALTSIAADTESNSPQVTARDSIVATVTGRLTTVWDNGKLFYASAKAGGTEIELDPVGCPNVTRELLDFINTQGGGFISSVEVQVTGELVFEKRAQSVRYREVSRNDTNAIVPALKVHTLKISTLPLGEVSGSTKRDRDTVKSTTIGVTKR